ncbi:MAG: hypoxanthine phosphoribosyltransferase [Planctomycetaceae bacterium]|nr:hypoxanthine phosphoribosyltransferase [Planctomycetaceae bacterium]
MTPSSSPGAPAASDARRLSATEGVRPLISATQIQKAVQELGARISQDYHEQPLTILGVLTGSLMLVADLVRQIQLPLKVGLIQASSYRGSATSPGELVVDTSLVPDVSGRHVLLVDDILDTGQTLQGLIRRLQSFRPISLKSAVLLWKQDRTVIDLRPDYHCFLIPDQFVVGYGLDFNDDYRHLPYIGVLDSSAMPDSLPRSE